MIWDCLLSAWANRSNSYSNGVPEEYLSVEHEGRGLHQPPMKESQFPTSAKVAACFLFLAISVGLWLSIETFWLKVIYYLLFLLPTYACGEWLGSKIFSEARGVTISEKRFSLWRIVVGVCTALTLFGLVYGLAFLGKWIVS